MSTQRVDYEGKVGPATLADGQRSQHRLTKDGGLVTQDGHARYQEAVLRGNVFWAANQAAVTTTVALATTYTGLCLSNPAGSGRNLILLSASWMWSVAPVAIASVHIGVGYSTAGIVAHTTPLSVYSNIIGGGAASVAKADGAATLVGTPAYALGLVGGFTAGALPAQPSAYFDIGGLLVLPPGAYAFIATLTVSVGFGFMSWEEVST